MKKFKVGLVILTFVLSIVLVGSSHESSADPGCNDDTCVDNPGE